MKNFKHLGLAVLAGLVLSGCSSKNRQTVIGTGDVESIKVDLQSFDGVDVTGTCNVDIQIGEPRSVEFYAQPEVLEVLTYAVKDGMLQIGFDPDYNVNTSKEIRAEITIPSFSYAGITGAADFELSGAQQDALDIYITGAGNVKAFDMPVNTCNIRISGTGNCDVHVSSSLDVDISGVGTIRYMGTPSLTTSISGVGNVIAVDP